MRILISLVSIFVFCCNAHVNTQRGPSPDGYVGGDVSWTDADCKSLHTKTIAYTAVAAALGALSGTGGITTAALTDSTPRWVTGGISVGLGALSAVFATLLKFADDDFSTGCRIAPLKDDQAVDQHDKLRAVKPVNTTKPVVKSVNQPEKKQSINKEESIMCTNCDWYNQKTPFPIR